MKKLLPLLLALALVFSLAACSSKTDDTTTDDTQGDANAESVDLVVFAAASMTETLNQIAEQYKDAAPNVTLTFNFDSSGTLKTQIEEGADCDVFISAAQKQMNQIDASRDADGGNTDALDFVLQGTRINLVENKVTLVVPEGNPAGVSSFDDVAADKVSLIALGNSDVPVGQYSIEILTNLGLLEGLESGSKITYGSNVKEVTTQVSEGAVDCGQVIYPAAVLNISQHLEEAKAFLAYLQGEEATAVFESVGFAPVG